MEQDSKKLIQIFILLRVVNEIEETWEESVIESRRYVLSLRYGCLSMVKIIKQDFIIFEKQRYNDPIF